jgi:hypothetical protein
MFIKRLDKPITCQEMLESTSAPEYGEVYRNNNTCN